MLQAFTLFFTRKLEKCDDFHVTTEHRPLAWGGLLLDPLVFVPFIQPKSAREMNKYTKIFISPQCISNYIFNTFSIVACIFSISHRSKRIKLKLNHSDQFSMQNTNTTINYAGSVDFSMKAKNSISIHFFNTNTIHKLIKITKFSKSHTDRSRFF